ncbi:hypothetical protein DFAR_1000003 [Desulfarculales bacterium]
MEGSGLGDQFQVLRQTDFYATPFYVSSPAPFSRRAKEAYFPSRALRCLRVTHLGPSRHH